MPGPFLAEFELYVMLAIAQLEDDAYGALVRQEIEARTGRPVSIGALYATLARLEEKGLLVLRTARSEPRRRGRARRYCTLTAAGRAALSHSAVMLQRMMRGLTFVEPTRKS